MEAILIRMNQEVAGRYSAETRDREEEFRLRLLKDLQQAPQGTVPGSSNAQTKDTKETKATKETKELPCR